MAEIVNLRRARKAKARSQQEKTAEANRIKHGAPKLAKDLAKARQKQAEQRLAAHRLEKDKSDN